MLRADIKSRIEETKILRKLKVLHVIINRTAWSRWWWHYNHQVSVRLNVTARFHVQPCMATNDIIFFKERVPTQFYFCFFNSLVWPLNIACIKQVYFCIELYSLSASLHVILLWSSELPDVLTNEEQIELPSSCITLSAFVLY